MSDPTPTCGLRFWQGLLLLATLDLAVVGGWGSVRPAYLFALLQQPANDDGLLLCRLLSLLYLLCAWFLVLAAWRPTMYGILAFAALVGRLAMCGVWFWLLESGRTPAAANVLLALLGHDAAWIPVFAGFLLYCWRLPSGGAPGRV